MLVITLAATGCASEFARPPTGEELVRYGNIVEIQAVELEGDHQLGLGAVIGAAAGALLGNQIGRGSGRDVATVIGAIGGGVAGNTVQNRYVDKRPGQHVIVELDNRVRIAITQPADPNLRVGDHVRVDGAGQQARVIRD
jgi:outer membrane lipoprotein SlyB